MICPICENQNGKFQLSHLLGYLKCEVCGDHFISRQIDASYPQVYFEQNKKPSLVARMAIPLLDFFYYLRVRKIKNLFKNNSNSKVLDYGCGSGKLVEKLLKQNINATGFEPSEGARIIAHRKNLPVYDKINPLAGGYDLIMFWHSLEHMDQPLRVIRSVEKYLNSTGKLLIAVPNVDSLEAKIFKENWFHYSYPFHLIHFTPKSVKIMLQKTGFYPISIDFWNPEYTVSGLVQSFLNWFLPKDTFYSIISHRRQTMPLYNAILIFLTSILIILIFSPFLTLFFIFQLICSKTGAIVIIARKEI